ncbi:aminotransferase [Methanococcoides burtonii DSM 6242]|uniref:Aminotransferase n=2 Tax=Methanococcoides burtonii TaxID=29291 RepID=Q12VL6_METBU|nr:aminotransferase [Methanococcoides burtonii DSM 6242]
MSDNTIRLSRSVIGEEEKKAVLDVLDRQYLGMGQDVLYFEQELATYFAREAVCVNTGTAALHLALQALGVGPGDEVLVQSLTYVASFQAISATGARPVPCDIDPDTITLNVDDAKKRITEHTRVVMPVHYASSVGPLDEIYEFAQDNDLRVVEDAAQAFGTYYNDKKVGSFGDIACFSFDGIKNITSGEGGAVVTDDKEVLQRVKDARLLGVEKDTEKRYSGDRSWDFDVSMQGWRYHMSNVMAAIGIEQFKKFPIFAEKRKELLKRYQSNLANINSIELLKQDANQIVPHIFVIKLKNYDRNTLRKMLEDVGIPTGIHYKPNHKLSYYDTGVELPCTDTVAKEILTLPLHPELQISDVDHICEMLKQCLGI